MKKSYIILGVILIVCIVTLPLMDSILQVRYKKATEFTSCINIGNALEAPKNIKWDVQMDEEYLSLIKEAGFDCVRLPVRFSDYINNNNELDEEFMEKIDYYINYALDLELKVILDFHHYIEIMNDPLKHKDSFESIWRQLSERYKKYPPELLFELLNEPKDNLTGEVWNNLIKDGVKIIRETNKYRTIIVGPSEFNSLYSLNKLILPEDENILLTFHYYEPNNVTFQGSPYHEGYEELNNIEWRGTEEEIKYLEDRFKIVKEYAEKNNIKVFLGEFGVVKSAPEDTRKRWIEFVKNEALKNGFSYGYWELASEFGVYDIKTKTFNKELLEILTNKK